MADTDELDEMLGPRDIEKMFKRTRRTIYLWVKTGKFPPPDIAGKNGAPNEWRRSTAVRHLNSTAPSKHDA
jgi:hypothetical protein